MLRRFISGQKILKCKNIVGVSLPIRNFVRVVDLPKVDKTVRLDGNDDNTKSKASFFGIFEDTYISKPTYCLTKELFEYILNDNYLQEEFPIIKQNEEIYINMMVLHVIILLYRLSKETSTYAAKEASVFKYYCKTNFFVEFASKVNDHMPAEDFASVFIENYTRRMDIFYKELETILNDLDKIKTDQLYKETEGRMLRGFLRKHIFLYEISEKDEYLEKLFKYFVAHKNYIMSLSYQNLTTYKIFWGFSKDTFLLQHFANESDSSKEISK